jgi:hypothetical protein
MCVHYEVLDDGLYCCTVRVHVLALSRIKLAILVAAITNYLLSVDSSFEFVV